MSGQIIQIRSIVLAVPLLVWGLGIGIPTNPARADDRANDCASAPHSAAPTGSHWYYHTDRTKRRKCWFLGPVGKWGQRAAATKVTSAATRLAQAGAIKKPATASTDALMSASAGGSTPPSPPPSAQPAPMSSATTQEPVQQGVQDANTAPSIPETPTALASASWLTSNQALGAAPAASIVWPDPTTVAPDKAQSPNLVLSDARADSVLPTARAPDDSGSAARSGASSTQAPLVEASPAARFAEILLVAVLGLAVAGLLYRVVMKTGAWRAANHRRSLQVRLDRRSIPAHVARQSAPAWIRREGEEVDEVSDDLHPSLVPAAGDYSARRPLGDESQNNARGKASASRITDEVSERENTLAQLILDLEQMLRARKGA
jgi:hypothetical protein